VTEDTAPPSPEMRLSTGRPILQVVVSQHADEIAVLHGIRQAHVRSAHVALDRLGRLDARVAAHLDGCVVAGPEGFRLLLEGLAEPDAAAMFAVAALVLEGRDRTSLEQCLSVAEAVPETVPGVISALGWVPRDVLTGIGRDLLVAKSPFRRRLGLAACRLHGVDPGAFLPAAVRDPAPGVRAEALRTAGVLGRRDLASTVTAAHDDDDPDCRYWAAWSAVLVGDRNRGLDALTKAGLAEGPRQPRAFNLALQAASLGAGKAVLQQLSADPARLRWLIQGSGIVGDAASVPWLIGHMAVKETARLAGEAFSLITGVDLAWQDLERKPPDQFEAGPNDNPEDETVDMDPDDGLPWPTLRRVQDWWDANGARFEPGTRYFVGAPVARAQCLEVLKNGVQRQRILAAHSLCLVNPGTPLFNTSAPAWRQRMLLVQME
jgi:uncharacterized protein (TIGR02270 family)